MKYADPGEAVRNLARMIRPPVRMSVSEAAAKYMRVRTPGGGTTNWDPSSTPYIVEPMDLLSSRRYEAVIFAGPARTGKTQGLVDGFFTYMVKCDQSDMQIVQTTQQTASDYSKLRVARGFRASPELKKELSPRKTDDNVYDKWLKSGALLKLSWPAISQLSGRDMKYMALTDYDRMPLNLGSDGSVFTQAQKRIQTFLSRGMVMAESSPGYEVEDPNWKPATPHEAPPTKGILGLYNQGDRRRMYWRCPHCNEFFLIPPGIEGFSFKNGCDLFGVTDTTLTGVVKAVCMANGCEIGPEHKDIMNAGAIWVPDGCQIEREGNVHGLVGTPVRTKTASFWMHGIAAAFQSWESIVQKYLNGMRAYELSGDEEALRGIYGLDFGTAYLPQRLAEPDERDNIEARAEKVAKYHIPEGVRTLVAAVDVQGGKKKRFVVQVMAVGIHNEKWLIDRYDIDKTADDEPINPGKFVEHWGELTHRVVNSTYKLNNGKELRVFRVVVDTGGEDGVQDRAYDWWRSLKRYGLQERIVLVKGKGGDAKTGRNAPKIKLSYPDSRNRTDRKSNARGDVPVYMLNTNKIKDAVANDLARDVVGPGYIHFPDWLQAWFFAELKAERRNSDGVWEKVSARNEAFDLLAYVYALLFGLKYEQIDWDRPPAWAAPWELNSEVITREQRIALKDMQVTYRATSRRGVRSRGL